MAWNQSNQSATKPTGKPANPRRFRGLIAALIVVIGGISAIFFLFSPWGQSPESDKQPVAKPTTIQDVGTNVVAKAVTPRDDVIVYKGKEYPRFNKAGGEAYISGVGVRYHSKVVYTNNAAYANMRWEAKLFTHHTDRTIALLLNTEPGTQFIGGSSYGKSFVTSFLNSLKDPIVINPDDEERVKEVKRAVIETRADLKARYDKGEDIAEIINATRKELQQLGAYKRELERELEKYARDKSMSEKDLDDYVRAANDMLAERGCSKLTMPEMIRRSVRMRDQLRKESQDSKSDKSNK